MTLSYKESESSERIHKRKLTRWRSSVVIMAFGAFVAYLGFPFTNWRFYVILLLALAFRHVAAWEDARV